VTPPPGDFGPDLAAATPRDPLFDDSVQPEVYDVSALQRLAILARPVSNDEAAGAVTGMAVYNDLPSDPSNFAHPLTTAATRIDINAAQDVMAIYDSVFGNVNADRTPEVGQTLAGAFDNYMSFMSIEQASSVDPARFRSWLVRQSAESQANGYVSRLRMLLDRLATIGLSHREYIEARRRILEAVAPSGGLDVEILIRVLESDPVVEADESDPTSELAGTDAS